MLSTSSWRTRMTRGRPLSTFGPLTIPWVLHDPVGFVKNVKEYAFNPEPLQQSFQKRTQYRRQTSDTRSVALKLMLKVAPVAWVDVTTGTVRQGPGKQLHTVRKNNDSALSRQEKRRGGHSLPRGTGTGSACTSRDAGETSPACTYPSRSRAFGRSSGN